MFRKSKSVKLVSLIVLVILVMSLGFVGGCGKKEKTQASSEQAKPKGRIVIASKQFAESYILAHMAAILLKEKAGLDVDTSKIGMGPTEIL
ncbi:MAG: glycine betaine ABC transporter substrate-binding protein, partial [Thermacetogeniaceae bacterium]